MVQALYINLIATATIKPSSSVLESRRPTEAGREPTTYMRMEQALLRGAIVGNARHLRGSDNKMLDGESECQGPGSLGDRSYPVGLYYRICLYKGPTSPHNTRRKVRNQ